MSAVELWLQLYVLGAFGWLAVLAFAAFIRPDHFAVALGDMQRMAGWSYRTALLVMTIAYSLLWPLTVIVAIALIIKERR
ncbi:hypothetical protein [Sphaerimonospora thailandensis]|uniref:Uncharacterized protein n=1 Tax=Sphaerimonospora thailandensis TaxID=795644 RepID=A0A8J3VY07_9ACTN|nr:hypothetical protein [Sphaerimonospora thailandensis]GIH69469.1 hypothetical protein Mth01_17220 [Sphaerimonospora thailandensis]